MLRRKQLDMPSEVKPWTDKANLDANFKLNDTQYIENEAYMIQKKINKVSWNCFKWLCNNLSPFFVRKLWNQHFSDQNALTGNRQIGNLYQFNGSLCYFK